MKPPRDIPADLLNEFTLNNRIAVQYRYIDNTSFIDNHKFYNRRDIDDYIDKIRKGETFYYGRTDNFLRQAFTQFPIKNKRIGIIGSQKPLYESFVLAYHGIPITIEYHKIETDDNRLSLLTVEEFEKNPQQFDAVLSISSIEHDGLGRYGDPINPEGDF